MEEYYKTLLADTRKRQNIGLQARILSQRTFTIFVVMAVVTTVATTPLVKWLYPPWYQDKMEKWRRGEADKDGNPISSTSSGDEPGAQQLNAAQIRRLLVYLRLDSLPSLFTFIALLGGDKSVKKAIVEEEEPSEKGESRVSSQPIAKRPLEVHGLRILGLTERTSSVMQVTEGEEYYSEIDPVVNAFRTFSRLNDIAVSGRVAIVPEASYSETLMKQASDVASDFVLVPWSEYGSITEDTSVPFVTSAQDRYNGRGHLDFINKTLEKSVCNTGIFINQNFGGMGPAERPGGLKKSKSAMSVHSQRDAATLPVKDKSHQVFFPFFGGLDDRVALRFALQLARSPHVTLTIAHFSWAAYDSGDEVEIPSNAAGGTKDAVKVVGETSAQDLALLSSLRSMLSKELAGRVTLAEVNVTKGTAVAEAVSKARSTVGNMPKNAGDIVVVGRSHHELGDSQVELGALDLRKTVGSVAEQLVNGGVKASVLVIKAGGAGLQW